MINLNTIQQQELLQKQQQTQVTQQVAQEENIFNKVGQEFKSWINDEDKVCEDGKDDGKLSWKENLEYFGKGFFGGIIKTAIKHPVLSLAAVGAGAVATAVLGPATVATAGLLGGAFTIGKGCLNALTANTDAQAKQAWETMGTGTSASAASFSALKGTLKSSGIDGVDDMSSLETVKTGLNYTKESLKAVGKVLSGKADTGIYIDSQNIAHLTSKSNISSQMDDVAALGYQDYAPNIDAANASKYLKLFGEYADGAKLNPDSNFTFIQAHGSMQLYDNTLKSNVVSTYESIKNPIRELAKWNINNK